MCAQLPWSPAQSKPGGVNHNAQNGRDPHAAHVCTVRRVWAVVFRTWGAANNGKSGAAHVGLSRPASSANIQTFRPASETVNKLVSNPLLRSMVFPGVACAPSTAPRRLDRCAWGVGACVLLRVTLEKEPGHCCLDDVALRGCLHIKRGSEWESWRVFFWISPKPVRWA